MLAYATALREQAAGRAVVVYYDESFCHSGHRRGSSLADTTDADATITVPHKGQMAAINSGLAKGKMLIIQHAFTCDGLLCATNADGSLFRVHDGAVGEQQSAEKVWTSGGAGTDVYHRHFDAQMFERWVTEP